MNFCVCKKIKGKHIKAEGSDRKNEFKVKILKENTQNKLKGLQQLGNVDVNFEGEEEDADKREVEKGMDHN